MHQLPRLGARALVLLAIGLASCSTPRVAVEKRDDGILHLKCKAQLHECLEEASVLCNHGKYAVLRAIDDSDFKGSLPSDTFERFPSSEAYVRCGGRQTLGAENRLLVDQPLCPAPVAAPSPPPPSSRACVPGSSQACVGPGGCHGGQACQSDGAGYAPCDCGTAPLAPASPTP